MHRPAVLAAVLVLVAAPLSAQGRTAEGLEIQMGVKIPLRDGVKLNATVYSPAGSHEPRPVILAMTPYMADRYHNYAIPIAKRGYVVAVVDVRGRGNSDGVFHAFEQEANDGYDTVEWLAAQPFSNGKVAMMGGSYGGFNQWDIAKEMPPHLATITPTAAAHLGIDFPGPGGIGANYLMDWLSFVSERNAPANLFGDLAFWNSRYKVSYTTHLAFASLDSLVGNRSSTFQRFISHPDYDDFWKGMAPSPEQLAKMTIPIFTRTGMYDGDQVGAMEHYRNHMKYASAEARAKHYLMIGPWDHAGTRGPQKTFGGLTFGDKSIIEMEQLEADWFDWTMKGGPQPKQLPKRVAYYVTGADEWKYADNLSDIGRDPTKYYLTSSGNGARSVYQSGVLVPAEPAATAADEWTYDPLDTRPGLNEPGTPDYTDVYSAMTIEGRGAIYHTAPFEKDTEISGFPSLTLWVTLDVKDSDLGVELYEMTRDGRSIALDDAQLRLRYREGRSNQVLITPGQPTKVVFDRFRFMSRRIAAGSRLRLVVVSPNSIQLEKNYNSGGEVARETGKDAKTAHIKLLHDAGHWSVLEMPIAH